MPVFASCAAYAVIDTLALLMWHQIFFSRVTRGAFHLPHLKALIDWYFRQCQPAPLPWRLPNKLCFAMPKAWVLDTATYDANPVD